MKLLLIIPLALLAFFLVSTVFAGNDKEMMQQGRTVAPDGTRLQKAMFAGGCFWCMEKPFEKLNGVISVTSGYAGGASTNPTYDTYAAGGHIEVVEVLYDPQRISYPELLDVYWRQINPTDPDGQFVDRGHAYTSAIFYYSDEQRQEAEASKKALAQTGIFTKPIVTPIIPAPPFYPAEEYHQDYYTKNPLRYKFYRGGSGRDTFLDQVWGAERNKAGSAVNIRKEDLKKRLTPMQYTVTQEDGTEPAYRNAYWDNKKPGIYVDIISGEPLFSSLDKYDSKSGWPSFYAPLVPENILERQDRHLLFMVRTEVRSKKGDSHLGHVFGDGPPPTGKRYCINSAALRFVPVKDLEQEGYGQFLTLFETKNQ